MATQDKAVLSPQAFAAWRRRLGLSYGAAAAALGYSRRQVIYFETGGRPVTRRTALLMQAVEAARKRGGT